MKVLATACLIFAISAPMPARADAIGGCAEGQIWRSNPTSPGAMHHGGGECVPDPSASHGCAAGSSPHVTPWSLALFAGAAVALRRRDKVRAR